jgi:hypothetical protein
VIRARTKRNLPKKNILVENGSSSRLVAWEKSVLEDRKSRSRMWRRTNKLKLPGVFTTKYWKGLALQKLPSLLLRLNETVLPERSSSSESAISPDMRLCSVARRRHFNAQVQVPHLRRPTLTKTRFRGEDWMRLGRLPGLRLCSRRLGIFERRRRNESKQQSVRLSLLLVF